MNNDLSNTKVAILATNGFEQSELFEPLNALKKENAQIEIVSLSNKDIKAWDKDSWGKSISVDKTIEEVSASDYGALLIPGGVMNPDQLRNNQSVKKFVTDFFKSGKPLASICHGPQVLIETNLLDGRKMTSYSSIKSDLINAGVDWVDEEVVVDNGLVTSRSPADLVAFCKKMIEEFKEGKHDSSHAHNKSKNEGQSANLS